MITAKEILGLRDSWLLLLLSYFFNALLILRYSKENEVREDDSHIGAMIGQVLRPAPRFNQLVY